ncbi:endonuclease domain-containing 1 protein-like [Archocentrus centrarchus]|uniref:endonuclease domain-containing 1 protein-like n=1 Tax=Archocentrus centrarchus TaxID=63155 RepID=UPI0011E9BABE|nr:endonuclease domain-containing 1 protein-like [Archocentrus centrarchus]
MVNFLTGALLSFLNCIGELFYGQITTDFKPCLRFFYKETIPQGISGDSYVALCQLYNDEYRFATLYDKSRRIPLYSAYILRAKVQGGGSRTRKESWKVQPELDNPGKIPMASRDDEKHEKLENSQAVNEDYTNSGYSRGHLAPSGHQETDDDRKATFTLTNIVPQKEGSNTGTWEAQEQKMLKRLKDCTSRMYVITGVMPYESNEPKINNRVHVPEYMWTAYCCESFKGEADQNHFPTYAAVGRNDQNSPEDIVKKDPNNKGYDVKEMSLESLEKILKERLKMSKLSLFKDQCKSDKSKTHH